MVEVEVEGAVLFDIDGTLLLGSSGHLNVLAGTLSRAVGREVTIDIRAERPHLNGQDVSGWIDVQIVRAVLRGASGEPPVERDVAAVMTEYMRTFVESTVVGAMVGAPVDGAAECLARLQAAGVYLGLVTGNASSVARAKLAVAGLDGYFSYDCELGFGDWRLDRAAIAIAAAAAARPIGVESGASRATQLQAAGAWAVVPSVAHLVTGMDRGQP